VRRQNCPTVMRAIPAMRLRPTWRHMAAADVIKLSEVKRGFVLVPWRWMVERSFWRGGELPAASQGLCAAARSRHACISWPLLP
jgi:anti-sigma factor ChrR (cupin superfamily)